MKALFITFITILLVGCSNYTPNYENCSSVDSDDPVKLISMDELPENFKYSESIGSHGFNVDTIGNKLIFPFIDVYTYDYSNTEVSHKDKATNTAYYEGTITRAVSQLKIEATFRNINDTIIYEFEYSKIPNWHLISHLLGDPKYLDYEFDSMNPPTGVRSHNLLDNHWIYEIKGSKLVAKVYVDKFNPFHELEIGDEYSGPTKYEDPNTGFIINIDLKDGRINGFDYAISSYELDKLTDYQINRIIKYDFSFLAYDHPTEYNLSERGDKATYEIQSNYFLAFKVYRDPSVIVFSVRDLSDIPYQRDFYLEFNN